MARKKETTEEVNAALDALEAPTQAQPAQPVQPARNVRTFEQETHDDTLRMHVGGYDGPPDGIAEEAIPDVGKVVARRIEVIQDHTTSEGDAEIFRMPLG